MDKIIETCKRHKIAMLADFAVPSERDAHLKCTTVLLDESHEPGDEMKQAAFALFPKRKPSMAITIAKGTP